MAVLEEVLRFFSRLRIPFSFIFKEAAFRGPENPSRYSQNLKEKTGHMKQMAAELEMYHNQANRLTLWQNNLSFNGLANQFNEARISEADLARAALVPWMRHVALSHRPTYFCEYVFLHFFNKVVTGTTTSDSESLRERKLFKTLVVNTGCSPL